MTTTDPAARTEYTDTHDEQIVSETPIPAPPARDPAFPGTFLGATVIIGPDAEFDTIGATDPHPMLTIGVREGATVVSLRFDPPQLLEFASYVRDAAANWVACAECDGTILRATAYTPDTGTPARWAPTFCGGPCAEQWSERNDPAVTR